MISQHFLLQIEFGVRISDFFFDEKIVAIVLYAVMRYSDYVIHSMYTIHCIVYIVYTQRESERERESPLSKTNNTMFNGK